MEVSCDKDYIDASSKLFYSSSHLTRNFVVWSSKQKERVIKEMEKYPFLRSFLFDSRRAGPFYFGGLGKIWNNHDFSFLFNLFMYFFTFMYFCFYRTCLCILSFILVTCFETIINMYEQQLKTKDVFQCLSQTFERDNLRNVVNGPV